MIVVDKFCEKMCHKWVENGSYGQVCLFGRCGLYDVAFWRIVGLSEFLNELKRVGRWLICELNKTKRAISGCG